MGVWGLIALSNFLVSPGEAGEEKNITMENLTHLKVKSTDGPEVKYDLIKAFPLIQRCIWMHMCVNHVCVLSDSKGLCHTRFQQPCILSTIEFLSFVSGRRSVRFLGVTPTDPAAWTYAAGLLTPMAASLFHFSCLRNWKVFRCLRGRYCLHLFSSKEFNAPYCIEY